MHVYLVRHGKTALNKRHIHQFPTTPLSDEGREEAVTTAEYLRSMNPDCLISSEYTRALETARIIGLHTGLTPETNALFYEIIRPSSVYGRSHFSVETFKYVILSVLRRNNKQYRYKDAENMHDLIVRIQKAFEYLEGLSKKHSSVVVVSHSVFMNLLVAHMCKESPLSFFELFKSFAKVIFTKNGSVLHLEYQKKTKKDEPVCPWQELEFEYHTQVCA